MSDKLIHGRYRLVRVIGEGGMGTVWLAEDTQTGQAIALKEIHPQLMAGAPEPLKRFEREAELLRKLNHPNIISALAFFEEDGRCYLAMPFMADGSLADLLAREGPLSVARMRQMGLDLCDALIRAHRLGVVHRDLKPENILLDSAGNPVLTDFGVARLKSGTALTKEGSIVGSVGYVSPEVCTGDEADERSDIWGLGVVFYEMLTGRSPFQRSTVSATLLAIISDPLRPLDKYRSDVPLELSNLLDVMLEKDAEFRIDSVRQVAAELEHVPDPDVAADTGPARLGRAPAPTAAPSLSAPSTPKKKKKKRPGFALLFGGALVVLLAVLLAMTQLSSAPAAPTPTPPPTPVPLPTLEPLVEHQRLLLVADFENLGGDEMAVGSIIADQLDRAYNILPGFQPVGVRLYPRVITGESEARQVGAALGADVVVWGTRRGARVYVRLTPIGVVPGRALTEATGLTRLPIMSLDEVADPLTFTSATLLVQTLLAKNTSSMAGLIFPLINEWPRPQSYDFIVGDTAAAQTLRFYVLFLDDKDAALGSINAAIRQEGTVPALFQLRAVLLSSTGRYDEALEDVHTATSLDPTFSGGPVMACVIHLAQADYGAAVAACEQAHALESSWYSGTMVSIAYLYDNRLDAAIEAAQASAADQPLSGYPYGVLALAQLRTGQLDEGFATFHALMQQFPDSTAGTRMAENYAAAWDIGRVYDAMYPLMIGRYDDALARLEPDENISDPSLSAFLSGLTYCITGENDAAEAAFTRAIDSNAAFELAYLLRAEVRGKQGDVVGAAADLVQAGALSPGADFDALVQRGLAGELDCTGYAFGAALPADE